MLPLTVAVPLLSMAPPPPAAPLAELPESVLSVTVNVAFCPLSMPPPDPLAELPERVLPLTVIGLSL